LSWKVISEQRVEVRRILSDRPVSTADDTHVAPSIDGVEIDDQL
jgi:hypothetical protein